MHAAQRAPFDAQAYRDPQTRPWLIRALGPLNRHVMLPHVLKLARFDLPAADEARLRAAVNPGTAAFIGPNHPEFTTDWMIDKELSRRVSPLMAHWAAAEIVNVSPAAQRFWLANNLIATVPGGGGKDYSVQWALAGHGVLLHPEGTVSWHIDRVSDLRDGIADMAIAAARRLSASEDPRPVTMVPIVWQLVFEYDVSEGLQREMAHIERSLGLPSGDGAAVERRFASLQGRLLRAAAARFDVHSPRMTGEIAPGDYFDAQDEVAWALRRRLGERSGVDHPDMGRFLRRVRRSLREHPASDPAIARHERAMLTELTRLHGFPREIYGAPTLAQEHISENLKRTRALLMTRGWREALHNLVPVAVAPRVAHVRVAESIAVREVISQHTSAAADALRVLLLELHHAALCSALDALAAETSSIRDRFRRPNPLAT